jgi:hypothetical protein
MQKKQPETDDIVKLKPIMGIRPGVWLFALYSFILLVILFLFLVLPGIRNPGSELILITEPQGAALRVDDIYMGTAKDKIFVPKGVHTLSAVLPGFDKETVKVKIPSRLFGSLFLPLRIKVEVTLKTSNPSGAFAQAASDFAEWSFAGEPTATWQIPLSLSEGAYRTGQIIGNTQSTQQTAAQILTAASRFTATRAAMRDIVRAKMLMDNSGLSPSPASAYSSITDILAFLSENPGSADWLFGLLPTEAAAMVKTSDWYKKEAAFLAEPKPIQRSWTAKLNVAGLSFSGVTNFMICESAISQAAFENFLNENEAWREIGASWFAASEYCRQLTSRLPASMSGMEVRLPTEAEWEEAAAAGVIKIGEGSPNGMGGWEWCADPFAPLQFFKADRKAIQAVTSPERSLRSSLDSSRASLPPEYSSPNVSFRPVIAEKNTGY